MGLLKVALLQSLEIFTFSKTLAKDLLSLDFYVFTGEYNFALALLNDKI
jgi:hypothetical protein